jgi:transcriptional regulator with XRE-family HTH domain
MNETIPGSELVQVRRATKISQADVADKMGADQSRVSRMESDPKVPVEEARKYLSALDGDVTAKAFIEHIDSKWQFITKPGFRHPCRKVLRLADEALAKLQAFVAAPGTPPDLVQQVKIYREVLRQSTAYLLELRHGVSLVGNIAVGKTTALCWLINLLIDNAKSLKQKAVLETGAGWVTLGPVQVSTLDSGLKDGEIGKFGLVVQPYSSEEIFRLANDLCTSLIAMRDGKETESRVPEEMERALRSMAGLTRKTPKDADEQVEDPFMDLAKVHDKAETLTAEFVALLKLDQRTTTDVWYDAPTKQDGLKWLQTEFRKINNGRNTQISLPRRVDVFVPMRLIEDSPFDLSFTDTKGADGTAVRPDIQTHLDDPRTVTVLCSRFAPDSSMLELLAHLTATGKASIISERVVFLVLPRPDEATAIDNEDGEPVDAVEEAYKLREAQIRTKLAKFPGGQALPILFYNASEEDTTPIIKRLHEKLDSIRAIQVARLEEVCAAINDLVSKRQQEQARAAFAKLRDGLRKISTDYSQLPAKTISAYDRMLVALRTSHPRTVWASARRNGDWAMLDSYHYVGVAANMDAANRTDKALNAVIAMIDQLALDPECSVIKNHLAVLKNDVATWRLKYLEEVSRRAKEIFRAVLYPDNQPWANGLAFWGQGKGFRDKVAENVQAWLKDTSREWMEDAIEGIIVKDWRKFFIARIEELAKESAASE